MAKRCIYFVRDNQLYTRTADVSWDKEAIEVSKELCRTELQKLVLPFMEPCVDVSSASGIYSARSLATCYVKDSHGDTVKDIWKRLDGSIERDMAPPGCHDLLYITSLDYKQVCYALSQKSFYDTFHNPDKSSTCNAKALASLQLLYQQGKVDYIEDMNKFLWWYFVNCQYPLEWIDKISIEGDIENVQKR